MTWDYEKLDENGKRITVSNYTIDSKKEYTGRFVFNVKAWFDENPDERIARGWIKHIHWTPEEMKEKFPFNEQTQVLLRSVKVIDEYTVEDDFHAIDKSEEMMWLQEMLGVVDPFDTDAQVVTYGGGELLMM